MGDENWIVIPVLLLCYNTCQVALMLLSYRSGPASPKKQNQHQHQLESTLFTASHDLDLASEDNLVSLRVYLQEKLRILPVGAKSQRTMIATWLCEVFLHLIAVSGGVADSKLLRQLKDFLRNNRSVIINTHLHHIYIFLCN
jgi:hypothetical protein